MNQLYLKVAALCLSISVSMGAVNAQALLLTDVNEESLPGFVGTRHIQPEKYRTVGGNFETIKQILQQAPQETANLNNTPLYIQLPHPYGGFETFEIWEYAMMEAPLAERYPTIRTFFGRNKSRRSELIRLDYTPAGFHAYVFGPRGTWAIDPYANATTDFYISYFKNDLINIHQNDFECSAQNDFTTTPIEPNGATDFLLPLGNERREYQLAVAATGEYTQFHGGTVAGGQAAIVTCINRVNGVYERDLAVRFILVANNDILVYTNAGTDPFDNFNAGTLINQSQTVITNAIGAANFDVGHTVSTGGGGLAGLGVVCANSQKGRGITGLPNPVGDPFYIDYVAHELGHQFNGGHTFNSSIGSCNGNRSTNDAYEPGSGSTIMAYAGICGSDNVQSNSDDYFHGRSYRTIYSHITGSANSCATRVNTGNTPPVVNGPDSRKFIPKSTPFRMTTVSASDSDGDDITYCWEQYDLGASISLTTTPTTGTSPLFRSYNPDTSNTRIFPRLQTIVNNAVDNREKLAGYTRPLAMRITVRDNKPNGGGVSFDTTGLAVTGNAGPFLVTQPNTNITWQANASATVTWDVANSNLAPVNCANVNILLSVDGGFTYPITLLSNTPNDGSAMVNVPNIPATSTARVMVEAADNVFFDISNVNFTIQTGPIIAPVADFTSNNSTICEDATITFSDNSLNVPTDWLWSFDGGTPASSTLQNPGPVTFSTPGTYNVTLTVNNSAGSNQVSQVITVNPKPTGTFTTIPAIGSTNTGSATVIPSGGLAPYTYQWITSPVQNTATATNLFPGNNNVIVTDANGCSATLSVTVPTNVSISEVNNGMLQIYPNPAAEWVYIQAPDLQFNQGQLTVYNTLGQVAYSQLINTLPHSISTASLPPGMYVGTLVIEQQTHHFKFIKQ